MLQVGPHTVFLSKKMKELTEASSRPASSPASSTRPAYERTKASITHLLDTAVEMSINELWRIFTVSSAWGRILLVGPSFLLKDYAVPTQQS